MFLPLKEELALIRLAYEASVGAVAKLLSGNAKRLQDRRSDWRSYDVLLWAKLAFGILRLLVSTSVLGAQYALSERI